MSCPCNLKFSGGRHYHPQCDDYCSDCNYDLHYCPGCGDSLQHGEGVCFGCHEMLKEEK